MTYRVTDEQLAAALTAVEDGAWDWHVPSGRVEFSDQWCRMLGYEQWQLPPHISSWERLVHPDDYKAVMVAVRDHLDGKTPTYQTEHRVRRRNGEWAWVLDRGKIVARDETGRAVRMIGTHKDITARRLEMEQLAANEARARTQAAEIDAIYRSAPVGLGFVDAGMRFRRVNARLAAMNGLSPEDHIGRTPSEVTPGIGPHIEGLLRHVIESGEPIRQLEFRAEAPGDPGELRDWVINYDPVFGDSGQVVGVTAAVAEVTAVKRAQSEARRAAANEARVLQQVHDAIIVTDLDGSITGWNPGAERIFGYRADEIIGRSVWVLCFAEERDARETSARAELKRSGAYTTEVRNKRADGSPVWIRSSVSLLRDENGEPCAMIGYSTDVTDRVLAEQGLAEALRREASARRVAEVAQTRAQQADEAKSAFLRVMSHELRAPLNAIGGHAQLLAMGLHGPLTDLQQDALGRIDVAHRHLIRLVSDVLDLDRVESGAVVYDIQPVEISTIIAEAEAILSPQIREKRLDYRVSVSRRCIARADRDKLVQVLVNLVTNAVKFTEPGGSLSIQCDDVERSPSGAGIVRIRVRDTGIGIPAERIEQIFEPFAQVAPASSGIGGGFGLGLAISREMTRGMGGDLSVSSVFGSGSVFTITLPAPETDGHIGAQLALELPVLNDGARSMSSFATYIIGFVILIIGLAAAAVLLNVPQMWIGVGVVILLGIGVLSATSRTKMRDPAEGSARPPTSPNS